jgi:hypothetical protein
LIGGSTWTWMGARGVVDSAASSSPRRSRRRTGEREGVRECSPVADGEGERRRRDAVCEFEPRVREAERERERRDGDRKAEAEGDKRRAVLVRAPDRSDVASETGVLRRLDGAGDGPGVLWAKSQGRSLFESM